MQSNFIYLLFIFFFLSSFFSSLFFFPSLLPSFLLFFLLFFLLLTFFHDKLQTHGGNQLLVCTQETQVKALGTCFDQGNNKKSPSHWNFPSVVYCWNSNPKTSGRLQVGKENKKKEKEGRKEGRREGKKEEEKERK